MYSLTQTQSRGRRRRRRNSRHAIVGLGTGEHCIGYPSLLLPTGWSLDRGRRNVEYGVLPENLRRSFLCTINSQSMFYDSV